MVRRLCAALILASFSLGNPTEARAVQDVSGEVVSICVQVAADACRECIASRRQQCQKDAEKKCQENYARYCSQCGTGLNPTDKYCSKCGGVVPGDSEPSKGSAPGSIPE